MDEVLIPYVDQLPRVQHDAFRRKIAEQLAKDLYPWFNQEVPEIPDADWIVRTLLAGVEELISRQRSSLGQALYRIDISEKKISELMALTGPNDRVRVLAEQILEREAKKVWMRMHYSPQ